jgi:predicted RNA binding protein YcfA (HicA-like mRNA interferase family)
MAKRLPNITIKELRKFLMKIGCELKRTKGGHEHWAKEGLLRPITFQSHIEPVPEFIMRNILRNLGMDAEDFWGILEDE